MKVVLRKSFLKEASNLPLKIKELLLRKTDIFRINQNDTRLHVKKLSGKLEGFYSLRLTREYRIIYCFENKDKAIFIDIGHRKDIYK
ncbi:MAG: hypothetical protein A2908_00720 [Candidatus Staskawiczbacteria bacterium RIFCSPLOWO2_01_FULL_38_12b]|uniref:Toxin YoeB n=1 Tax=Candidatus Staskawiczbacteria bacterium RIFCSPLOWO2_01_FULL_38_12b TaxID=1802214 RepID=A0A1G2IFW3_9BACT|nr:MAG: hypothetical protein A2908_00720 [Candidatus Staskawiczbacteria bacterium RIFCSPLOWO2_01_FULL_38_12b]